MLVSSSQVGLIFALTLLWFAPIISAEWGEAQWLLGQRRRS
eukprot:gene18234-25541_t